MLFLWGLYIYAGSLTPTTRVASESEALTIWGIWIALTAIPVVTLVWLIRYWRRN